jgi:sodium/proline symporter/sodium/pantothenate symporter
VIGFGLNWRGATKKAAAAAIISSLLINGGFVVYQLMGFRIAYGIAGGAIALLVSTTLFVGLSLFSKPDPLPRDIEEVMKL